MKAARASFSFSLAFLGATSDWELTGAFELDAAAEDAAAAVAAAACTAAAAAAGGIPSCSLLLPAIAPPPGVEGIGESRPGGRGKEEPAPPSATRSRGDGCGGGTAAIAGIAALAGIAANAGLGGGADIEIVTACATVRARAAHEFGIGAVLLPTMRIKKTRL